MKNILFTISLLITTNLFAQLKPILGKSTYNFWLHNPTITTEEKQPLIVFLHGRSLSGTDINRVKRYGILKAIEKGVEIPAVVIAPQLPSGAWNADKLNELIDFAIHEYNIDTNRIYVAGMSLGSYGTTRLVGAYPEKIAAAVSICGGGLENDACNISKVPIKIIHGDKDFIVPISESKKIVNAIKSCNENAPVTFEIVKGGNHGSVENIFRSKEIYDWLLSHSKNNS